MDYTVVRLDIFYCTCIVIMTNLTIFPYYNILQKILIMDKEGVLFSKLIGSHWDNKEGRFSCRV